LGGQDDGAKVVMNRSPAHHSGPSRLHHAPHNHQDSVANAPLFVERSLNNSRFIGRRILPRTMSISTYGLSSAEYDDRSALPAPKIWTCASMRRSIPEYRAYRSNKSVHKSSN